MIEAIPINENYIKKNWKNNEDVDYIKKVLDPSFLNDEIPLYSTDMFCDALSFPGLESVSVYFEYGYCDTEDALYKYLKPFADEPDNSYFVTIGLMDMEYEKYYKNGTYINKDGVDTHMDYYDYIDDNPEMEVKQDYKDYWITFTIRKIKKPQTSNSIKK